MRKLKNIPFEELTIGAKDASLTRTLTEEDLLLFAKVSGDTNPVHLDESFAATTQFEGRIAHGMWTASLISCALATRLPGPGGIYLGQELKFLRPVKVGDTVTVELEVLEINERRQRATVSTNVVNQDGKTVVKGKAEIMPSSGDVEVDEYPLPDVELKPAR
ncbi:MaoC family dehydratase [Endozoicomonas ascidiicola]|uniref:MaoC family dehydratase n=1 Tax=Endozoicomonas ascidiicola TaxID=1698521 RepID=UPI00082AA45C|nr:MaoC family dehydratase [Endozoicomonas ascidiicola]